MADAELLGDVDADENEFELVGVAVTVTLNTDVRRLVTGTNVSPERVDETIVAVLVVSDRDVGSEAEAVESELFWVVDCAAAE